MRFTERRPHNAVWQFGSPRGSAITELIVNHNRLNFRCTIAPAFDTIPTMETDVKLAEFVSAQNPIYDQVRRELGAGRKESHWIWFIFPQLTGLGHSPMSRQFGIASQDEARRYLGHPVLGARLRECLQLLLGLPTQDIDSILGYPDNLKFRSCVTLFTTIAPHEALFQAALDKFFAGQPDALTLDLLREMASRE
jgi:uncharacterized protein (DUF1810 family)